MEECLGGMDEQGMEVGEAGGGLLRVETGEVVVSVGVGEVELKEALEHVASLVC
jgi:hypothetical protein